MSERRQNCEQGVVSFRSVLNVAKLVKHPVVANHNDCILISSSIFYIH